VMYLDEADARKAAPVELGSWLGGLACAVATLVLFPAGQWLWDMVARVGI